VTGQPFAARHPMLAPVLATVGVLIGVPTVVVMALLLQISMFYVGYGAGMGWLFVQGAIPGLVMLAVMRRRRRKEAYAAVLARAEHEHRALMRGDTAIGVFGRFPPASM
jgi:hypothetical protein